MNRTYPTTLRAIIPLPDPNALPTSAAHLNAYRQFPANSTVMALYPDTSCFYRAEVIASPQGKQPIGKVCYYVFSSSVLDFDIYLRLKSQCPSIN